MATGFDFVVELERLQVAEAVAAIELVIQSLVRSSQLARLCYLQTELSANVVLLWSVLW